MTTKTETPEVPDSGPKSDKKSPGFWFYTADYEKDMQILSLQSQGLWARMLCWMHDNEAHRGFAELPTGEPMTKWDIAARVGKTVREVEKSLMEMERIGTYSKDDRKCIYCRRMARDTHISIVRRAAAKSRMDTSKRAADGSFAGGFGGAKEPAKQEQNPTVTASVSDTVSDTVLLTQEEGQKPVIIRSTPEWKTDPEFLSFVADYESTGGAFIDEDYLNAHQWAWKKLDFEQKAARHASLLKHLELQAWDHPKYVPKPRKFIDSEWKRPVLARAPPASAKLTPTQVALKRAREAMNADVR